MTGLKMVCPECERVVSQSKYSKHKNRCIKKEMIRLIKKGKFKPEEENGRI